MKIKVTIKETFFFIVGLLFGIIVMALFNYKKPVMLKDGEELVVSTSYVNITSNDLYNELKDEKGLNTLLNMININLVKSLYELTDDDKNIIESQASDMYTSYKKYYGYSKKEFLENNGFEKEKDFIEYLQNDYLLEKYYKDYVAGKIMDKEINKYYKENVFGKKSMFIFNSDSKKDLNNLVKNLEKGIETDKIKSKFKNINIEEIKDFEFDTNLELSDTLINEIKKLEKNEFSQIIEDNEKKYIIFVYESSEKELLEEIKDRIIKQIVKNKKENEPKLYYQAFINLQKKYNIKFYDEILEEEYNEYVKNYN